MSDFQYSKLGDPSVRSSSSSFGLRASERKEDGEGRLKEEIGRRRAEIYLATGQEGARGGEALARVRELGPSCEVEPFAFFALLFAVKGR